MVLSSSCKKSVTGEYSGTASVTKGLASTTNENLYSNGIRVAGIGSITAEDNSVWTVPAEVNFTNTNFTNIFDDANNDAQFIWSTNVILGNEVIVRKVVQ